jgi:hypothetical protein
MALIRGTKGLLTCPICLVPDDEQSNLSVMHELRTADQTKACLDAANALPNVTATEKYLQQYGLRNVEVCSPVYMQTVYLTLVKNAFWGVENSDPHRALSWDRLHAYHQGLFKRLWTELQKYISALGPKALSQVDEQYVVMFPYH